MYLEGERRENEQAYRRLKPMIDQTYPQGRYIALDKGEIVGDGATFEELNAVLNAAGRGSGCIFVIQAGEDYPDWFEVPGMRLCPVPKRAIVLTPHQQEQVQRHLNYVRLKPEIDRAYPRDQFVAIEEDEVIADAATFKELVQILEASGKASRRLTVIQAGQEEPDYQVII